MSDVVDGAYRAEIRRLEAEITSLTTALEEAKSDELRNINGDYDHIKEEYYTKGFNEAREAACEKLKSDLLTVDSMTKIAKKRSWGTSPAFLDGVAQGVHQCIAAIRTLTPTKDDGI